MQSDIRFSDFASGVRYARGIFHILKLVMSLCVVLTLYSLQLLWKAYIDFEIAERETERVRHLYRNLLDRTSHVKVRVY